MFSNGLPRYQKRIWKALQIEPSTTRLNLPKTFLSSTYKKKKQTEPQTREAFVIVLKLFHAEADITQYF